MAQWSERVHRIISLEPEPFPRGTWPSLLSLQQAKTAQDKTTLTEDVNMVLKRNEKPTANLKHPYPHILINNLRGLFLLIHAAQMTFTECRGKDIRTLCIQLRVYSHPIRTLKGASRWFNQQPFCWLFLRTGIIDWWCHRDKQKCQINGSERHAVRRHLTFLSIKYSVLREKLWCKLWMSLSFSLQKFPKGHEWWQRLIYNQQPLVNKQLKECLE